MDLRVVASHHTLRLNDRLLDAFALIGARKGRWISRNRWQRSPNKKCSDGGELRSFLQHRESRARFRAHG
jgi:hypothetical protein